MKTTIKGKEIEVIRESKGFIVADFFKAIPLKYYGVAIVLLIAVFFVNGMINDAKKLGIAEERERQAQISKRDFEHYDKLIRESWERESKTLEEFREYKIASNQKIAEAKKEGKVKKDRVNSAKTPFEVASDVKEFLNFEPEITPAGSIAFNIEQTKEIINHEIDRTSLITELEETQHQLAMQTEAVKILEKHIEELDTDLLKAKKALNDMESSSNAYKKAAKKSFGQKLWSSTKKVGGYVAVATVVALIASHQ